MDHLHRWSLLLIVFRLFAADFPAWRGDGSGSAGAAPPLIDDWAQARIAWLSEARSPHPWNFSVVRGKTQWPRTVLGNGGYCHPALAGGRIYVMTWRGSGETLAETGPGGSSSRWASSGLPELQHIDADAVVVCMAAATGRTIWETVIPGTEMNHVELYGGHNHIAVADGRVFAIGGTGLIYALEADSGALLWHAELGASAAVWRWYEADCLARRSKEADPPTAIPDGATAPPAPPVEPRHELGGSLNNATYNICPVVVGDAVISGDWARGGGYVAFAAADGRELWRRRGLSGISTPLRWRDHAVILPGARQVQAVAAHSGEPLWSIDAAAGPTNCAVAGDVLVAPGQAPKGSPRPGWGAWRLDEAGAEPLWQLDGRYRPCGYLAAIAHDGRVWLPFERDGGSGAPAVPRGHMGLACVELDSGRVLGETRDIPANKVCPGPLAMGDRLLYQYDMGLILAALDPERPRFLGLSRQHSNYCSSCTAGDGFVYFRSGERQVVCLDLRRDQQQPPARHDRPADARYEIVLPGLRPDGRDVRLCLVGRDGRFPQSWLQTLAPGYGYPDVIEADDLRLEDGRLHGSATAIIEGSSYALELDLQVAADGSVHGSYRDTWAGTAVGGEVAGTVVAQPGDAAKLRVHLPRNFFNGQNQSQEPVLDLRIADGAVRDIALVSRQGADTFSATVLGHDLRWEERRLRGGIELAIDSRSEIAGGRYRLEFDAAVRHNLVWGSFTAQRAGAAETRHGITTYPPFSTALPPPDTPATLADAALTIDLPQAAVSTMGRYDLRLHLTHDAGGLGGVATTATVGLHPVDTSELVIDHDTVRGTVRVAIPGDGYALRSDTDNEYHLDLRLVDGALRGSYRGLADRRSPRSGDATGTWHDED